MPTDRDEPGGGPGEPRRGVQSVETAAAVLYALSGLGRASQLRDVALAAGIAPAKAHRYLIGLIAAGLAEQEPSGVYRLGTGAMRIGLSALRQMDVVALSGEYLENIRDRTGFSAFCAVFGDGGATVVRQSAALDAIVVNVRPGLILPLATSATGRVICAFGSPLPVVRRLAAEQGIDIVGAEQLRSTIAAGVAAEGMVRIEGLLLPGISAIAAPVFDDRGGLAGVLTTLGPSAAFDAALAGPVAGAVRKAAEDLSFRLGYSSDSAQ